MEEQDVCTYVNAAAALAGLPLDAAQAVRVAAHLQRTAAMAALLDAFPLHDEVELAELYCPSAFCPGQELS